MNHVNVSARAARGKLGELSEEADADQASMDAKVDTRENLYFEAKARAERDIEELQRYLRRDGAYEGKVDGQWGTKTEAALAQYRRERRESVDRIKVLAARLRLAVEEAGPPQGEEQLARNLRRRTTTRVQYPGKKKS